MENNSRKIIAATRSLVRHCDEGQAAHLQRLTSPLPPMLIEDSQRALDGFHALTRFNPTDQLRDHLPNSIKSGEPKSESDPGPLSIVHPGIGSHTETREAAAQNKSPRPAAITSQAATNPGTDAPGAMSDSRANSNKPPTAAVSATKTPAPFDAAEAHTRQTPSSDESSHSPSHSRRNATDNSATAAIESKTASKMAVSGTTTQRPTTHRKTGASITPSEQTNSSQTQQTTPRPKPRSLIEQLAARRKVQAQARNRAAHEADSSQDESDQSQTRTSQAVDADTVPRKLPPSSTDEQAALHSTSDKQAVNASPNRPMETDSVATSSTPPSVETTTPPQSERRGPQPHATTSAATSATGSATKNPVKIDRQTSAPPHLASAAKPPDSAQLPQESLAQQLANSAYLHGVDRT